MFGLNALEAFVIKPVFFFQGYGVKYGAFCGVFDGHGKNGQIVSRIVRDQLPSLVLDQKNALAKMEVTNNRSQKIGIERLDEEEAPSNEFYKWQEACVGAFKVMDKEVKLQENLDCSCSGTTAVVVIRQVLNESNNGNSRFYNLFWKIHVHFSLLSSG